MPTSNPTDIARVVRELFETPELPSLGPKRRQAILPVRELLDRLNSALHHSPIREGNRQLVRSVLLLWQDHLDESHSISQGIDDSDGSFVHGIMHRREPDYGNSCYWFRRVGNHPCFPTICMRVQTLLSPAHSDLADQLVPNGAWDPFGFVNACKLAESGSLPPQAVQALREVQRIETAALLERFLQA